MTDIQALITATELDGYRDNRATSDRLEAVNAEAAQLQERLKALQQDAQQVNADYSQREEARRSRIDALRQAQGESDVGTSADE